MKCDNADLESQHVAVDVSKANLRTCFMKWAHMYSLFKQCNVHQKYSC